MKIASVLGITLWVVSFCLAFVFGKDSIYLWVPDLLLLLGFLPFLFVWRPSWPWLLFGFCNLLIGFVLEMTHHIPDTNLPQGVIVSRDHLSQYHVPMVWILSGFASIIYGLVRMAKNITVWLLKKRKS